mgnify:CR=1 FL=1
MELCKIGNGDVERTARPLLEKIADTLFSESDRWEGTASELCEKACGGYKAECTFFKAQYQRKQAVS